MLRVSAIRAAIEPLGGVPKRWIAETLPVIEDRGIATTSIIEERRLGGATAATHTVLDEADGYVPSFVVDTEE